MNPFQESEPLTAPSASVNPEDLNASMDLFAEQTVAIETEEELEVPIDSAARTRNSTKKAELQGGQDADAAGGGQASGSGGNDQPEQPSGGPGGNPGSGGGGGGKDDEDDNGKKKVSIQSGFPAFTRLMILPLPQKPADVPSDDPPDPDASTESNEEREDPRDDDYNPDSEGSATPSKRRKRDEKLPDKAKVS